MPLEGFIGDGSREFPMNLVSVDRVEDVEDLVPPIPIPPPRRSLEERLGPVVGLQARLERNYDHWIGQGGDPDGASSDQERYWDRVLEVRGVPPLLEYPAPPSYHIFSPPI